MKINYKMTYRDYVAFLWYYNTHSIFRIIFNFIVSCYISWTFLKVFNDNYSFLVMCIAWIILMLVILIILIIFGFIFEIVSSISKKKNTDIINKSIELTDNVIITENKYCKRELNWNVIQKLKRTNRRILIFIGKDIAIIVPKRAFKDNQEFNSFYRIVESHYNKNR